MDVIFKRQFSLKTSFFLWKNHDFEGSGGRSWVPKSIQNRSKKELNLGRHLGIDVSWILVDFRGQVGTKLGSKIDPKWHRKNRCQEEGVLRRFEASSRPPGGGAVIHVSRTGRSGGVP